MLTKIDWISFTVPMEVDKLTTVTVVAQQIRTQLEALHAHLPEMLGLDGEVVPMNGRKPYSFGYRVEGEFISIYASKTLPHALIEISGQGCEKLEEKDLLTVILSAAINRLTRVDVACDFLTDLRPKAFVDGGYSDRIQSHGEIISRDGDTQYVGSRTSDRFCRVYRYNPPHVRSHLLRIEYQLKRENAKIAAQSFLETNLAAVAGQLGTSFGWRHSLWTSSTSTSDKLPSWSPDRHDAKTMFWLNAQVAPALIKAQRSGMIDVQLWFSENVLQKLFS